MEENEKVKGPERWTAAIANLTEMASNLDSLQKLLINKAVYVDDETFAKASLSSVQAHTIKVLEQRVETLEKERSTQGCRPACLTSCKRA